MFRRLSRRLSAGTTFASFLFLASNGLNAGVIQDSPVLPPSEGVYDLNLTVCLLAACITGSEVGNFVLTSSRIESGNQYVTATATLEAIVFRNNGGVPGVQIGTLNLVGEVGITYVGRNTATKLGTFESILTMMTFTGEFNGNTLNARLNGDNVSSGMTSIVVYKGPTAAVHDRLYEVDSFFTVYPELSLNGGPYIPGPARHAILKSPVPEAQTGALLTVGLAALGAVSRWRRRRGTTRAV